MGRRASRVAWLAPLLVGACARVPSLETAYEHEPVIEVTVLEAVPSAYVGRWVAGTGAVGEVVGDGLFWLGEGGQRLLVAVDPRRGAPPRLARGAEIRLRGLLLPGRAARESAAWLGPSAHDTLRAQERFLLVDVTGLNPPPPDDDDRAPSLTSWDTDRDGFVSADELRVGLADELGLARWDVDRDARLDRGELEAAMFDVLDADNDGRVSRTEWERGVRVWYGDAHDPRSFDAWDVDDDGTLDRRDVAAGLRLTGLLEAWDTDGDRRIGMNEAAAGALAAWDLDDDRRLGLAELRPVDRSWLRDREAFRAWDLDGDDRLTQDEVVEGWRRHGLFDVWDVGPDDLVGPSDLNTSLFAAWDVDGDGTIERFEFEDGFDAWFPDAEASFFEWDLDGDGRIDLDEFVTTMGGRAIWDAWDQDDDGFFTSDELQDGMFGIWDRDGDGLWDWGEYAVFF